MGGRHKQGSRSGSWVKTVDAIRAKLREELLKEVTGQLTDQITDRIDRQYRDVARQVGRRVKSLLYQRRSLRLQLQQGKAGKSVATPVLPNREFSATDLPRPTQTSASSQTGPDSISRLVDQVNRLMEENVLFNRLRFVCKTCTKS
jgi:hypothetical protein